MVYRINIYEEYGYWINTRSYPEAGDILVDLANSEAEEIAEAAIDAMILVEGLSDDFDFDE